MNGSPRRIALGTVQFGLPYGIANKVGQVERTAAASILTDARAAGIDTLDTAIAYGQSEQVLGEIGVSGWRIVTKLPPLPDGVPDITRWVDEQVAGSMQRLGVSTLYGLLLHRARDLTGPRGTTLYGALRALRERAAIAKLGVSIYDPDELDALPRELRVDLVQAPFNVIDRRIESSGWLARLAAAGVEVHVRSVFLQGLLLMDRAALPGYFETWRERWDSWHGWLARERLSALSSCLAFALSRAAIARVVVGVDSPQQLQGILLEADRAAIEPPAMLSSNDPALVNPSRWARA
jgi:aryl-alcohol dehydrogenase-like predicted oxidoreductase